VKSDTVNLNIFQVVDDYVELIARGMTTLSTFVVVEAPV